MSTAQVLAIDGPSASGKGTVAARVAAVLGWHFLDSGAIYRVLGHAAAKSGVEQDDESGLASLAHELDVRFEGDTVWLGSENVSLAIRAEAAGNAASRVASLPAVRASLLERQRAFRQPPGLVADGRDMGSIVFPDAACKVFMTASALVRAERRYKQLIAKGLPANIESLHQELLERDARDSSRAVAPLKPCEDAWVLDTSTLSIDEAVSAVLAYASRRGIGIPA